MARSQFIPQNNVKADTVARYDVAIRRLLEHRARVLFSIPTHADSLIARYNTAAWANALHITKLIVALQAAKGEQAPLFKPCFRVSDGRIFWLCDILANGNAKYSTNFNDGGGFRRKIWKSKTVSEQRLQSVYERLRREHAHNVEEGESARFSTPDALTGYALEALCNAAPEDLLYLVGDALEQAYLLDHPDADPWELGWQENGTGWTRYDGKVQ